MRRDSSDPVHDWYDLNENAPPADTTTWKCRRCDLEMIAPGDSIPNGNWGKSTDCDARLVKSVLEA